MEPEELVVSDIHVECKRGLRDAATAAGCPGLPSLETALTRFIFVLPDVLVEKSILPTDEDSAGTLDEDGDLVVRRHCSSECVDVFEIEHGISTTLEDVGLQVWAGALIMCDFVLAYPQLFSGHSCLELGAGSGLTSLTLALVAKHVICTDGNMKALNNCLNNIRRNRSAIPGQVRVLRLNWSEDTICPGAGDFDWSTEDIQLLAAVDVLVAADVFYDDKATMAFFGTLQRLFIQSPSRILYLSLEKRFNFSLEDCDVTAPAYSRFKQCLSDLKAQRGTLAVDVEMLPTDFPQYFRYDRSEQLEIWRISSRRAG